MIKIFSPTFNRQKHISGYSKLMVVFGLIILTGCTDTNGASKMNINEFFADSRIQALIKAAEKNDMDKLSQLVREGVNPNTFGKEHMTPLFWAVGHQNKKAMKALLSVGADPNLKDPEGDSPMTMAAGAKDSELLKILLDGGGDPNMKNDVDEPALFVAIGQKRIENVKILLDYGADINATDRTSTTAVMDAATLNQYHIVEFLLERGADHKHLTRGGVSLAEIVQDSTVDPEFEAYEIRKKVIKMLEERGVKFPVPSSEDLHTP
jgi:ankyrin repeat protein